MATWRYRIARLSVRAAHRAVNMVAVCLAAAVFLLGGYGIWENKSLVGEGEALQWQDYKPFLDSDDAGPSFAELAAANADVRGWITLDDTPIDYPLLYSEKDGKYLNRDALGNFSLAGSIFFDSQTPPSLSALPTVLYGHHMEGEAMFGPLTEYRSETYLASHRTGTMLSDGVTYKLDVVGVIETNAYDAAVYRRGGRSEGEYRSFLDEKMSVKSGDGFDPSQKIVLLSTCTTVETNGRLILVTQARDGKLPPPTRHGLSHTGAPILGGIAAAAACSGLGGWLYRRSRKHADAGPSGECARQPAGGQARLSP